MHELVESFTFEKTLAFRNIVALAVHATDDLDPDASHVVENVAVRQGFYLIA